MLDQLEKLAKAATPGPWEVKPWLNKFKLVGAHDITGPKGEWIARDGLYPGANGSREANANFIAAANPETVLKLIAVARVAIHCVSYNRDCYKGPLANELRRAWDAVGGFERLIESHRPCGALVKPACGTTLGISESLPRLPITRGIRM